LLLQRTALRRDFIQFIAEDASNFLDIPSRFAFSRRVRRMDGGPQLSLRRHEPGCAGTLLVARMLYK